MFSFPWFFKAEIFNFLNNLSSSQWIVILGVLCVCLAATNDNVKHFTMSSINNIYSKINKFREKDAEQKGKSLANFLEKTIFVNIFCWSVSTAFFHHYPLKFLNLGSVNTFLFFLVAYCLVELAFNRKMLFGSVGLFSLMPFTFYPFAFISNYTGENIFETFPPDVTNYLSINVYNLAETANKLFVLTAPACALVVLFLISSSIITRGVLTSFFNKF